MGDFAAGTKAAPAEELQFGHGGDAVGDWSRPWALATQPHRFNSATAVTPWVTWNAANGTVTQVLLQFGHGGDAVGDGAAAVPAGRGGAASIRPRR